MSNWFAEKGTGYQPKLVVTYTTGVAKTSSETGSGADDKSDYPAIILSLSESGAGAEALATGNPNTALSTAENGQGSESISLTNPIAPFSVAAEDSGDGSDGIVSSIRKPGTGSDIRLPGGRGKGEMPSRQTGIKSRRVNFMNLTDMIAMVRKDLHDEDGENYRWTDDELERHIGRAVREFSEQIPLPAKATLATTADSRDIDITSLEDRVMVEAVEYPAGETPPEYCRFSVWGDTLTIVSDKEPDGSNCCVYYGALHALDADGSTIPAKYEDLIATGACGYAAIAAAAGAINKVNAGGTTAPEEFRLWGSERLGMFQERVKRLGRKNRVRAQEFYGERD